MRIMMVSRSWPAYERSGVSLAAHKHAKILIDEGHELHIVGSNTLVDQEELDAVKHYIPSAGSGALYAPVRIDKKQLTSVIKQTKPDLIIVEAWQTALTEASIDVAAKQNIPVLMVSHGISIHPFTNSLRNWVRYLAWLPYQWFCLPSKIQKLSAITALNLNVNSPRFYDRDLAKSFNKSIFEVTNSPALQVLPFKSRAERKNQILVVGYFSEVKNQLEALNILSSLPKAIKMKFIGKREGSYFQRCQDFVREKHLEDRAIFCEDHEVDLASEYSESILVLQTSITEALPITLLEAMASGTPFVATPVGATTALQGGLCALGISNQILTINKLLADEALWNALSEKGRLACEQVFTDVNVKQQLCNAVNYLATLSAKGD